MEGLSYRGPTVRRSRFGLTASRSSLAASTTGTPFTFNCCLSCETGSAITSLQSRRSATHQFLRFIGDSLFFTELPCFFTGRPPSFGIAPLSALIYASLSLALIGVDLLIPSMRKLLLEQQDLGWKTENKPRRRCLASKRHSKSSDFQLCMAALDQVHSTLSKHQREATIRRKMCAPYFLTMPAPMPCTANNSASFLGAVAAMLSSARSPNIRNAGILLRLASLKRHARNACSIRC